MHRRALFKTTSMATQRTATHARAPPPPSVTAAPAHTASAHTAHTMLPPKAIPVNLAEVPVLRGITTYKSWRWAVENQLLVADLMGIIDGTDTEPFADRLTRVEREMRRSHRAGFVRPQFRNAEESATWAEWRHREHAAQALLRTTVSQTDQFDLDRLQSARDMWIYLEEMYRSRSIRVGCSIPMPLDMGMVAATATF